MGEFDLTRTGLANLGETNEDTLALFRDQFVPYLITQFDAKRVIKPLVYNKTITKGKSASFPVFGKVGAKYFAVGDRAIGNQKFAKNEVTIYVDPILVTDVSLYDLDERMSETADRAIIADEMSRALANQEDKLLLQTGVLAARANANIVDGNAGSIIEAGSASTDAAVLAAAIYSAGVELDVKNVPDEGRMCFVRPLQYSLLCQYENIADKNIGGGSYEAGTTGTLNGIKIIKTNHLPDSYIDESEYDSLPNNTYYGDFRQTAALVMTPQAIGTVTLHGVITELSWDSKEFCHLLTARVAEGHSLLRPECAVEIADTDISTEDE